MFCYNALFPVCFAAAKWSGREYCVRDDCYMQQNSINRNKCYIYPHNKREIVHRRVCESASQPAFSATVCLSVCLSGWLAGSAVRIQVYYVIQLILSLDSRCLQLQHTIPNMRNAIESIKFACKWKTRFGFHHQRYYYILSFNIWYFSCSITPCVSNWHLLFRHHCRRRRRRHHCDVCCVYALKFYIFFLCVAAAALSYLVFGSKFANFLFHIFIFFFILFLLSPFFLVGCYCVRSFLRFT